MASNPRLRIGSGVLYTELKYKGLLINTIKIVIGLPPLGGDMHSIIQHVLGQTL